MSPDTLEAIRCALHSVCETGGTMDELALLEQSDLISNLKAENAKLMALLTDIVGARLAALDTGATVTLQASTYKRVKKALLEASDE